jgi:hypothetical protein
LDWVAPRAGRGKSAVRVTFIFPCRSGYLGQCHCPNGLSVAAYVKHFAH